MIFKPIKSTNISFDLKNSANTSEIKREPVTDTTDENGMVFSKIQTKSPCIRHGMGKCVLTVPQHRLAAGLSYFYCLSIVLSSIL